MADKTQKKKKKQKKKKEFLKEFSIAYRGLENPRKFYIKILLPLIILSILMFSMPIILNLFIPYPIDINPLTFIIGGIIPIFLGIFYPYITWKNKENDINSKMHFFITHLRVLAISDLSLKEIIKMLGGKKVLVPLEKSLIK